MMMMIHDDDDDLLLYDDDDLLLFLQAFKNRGKAVGGCRCVGRVLSMMIFDFKV